MEKIKVGIVASGMMGQRHIDAVRRVPGVKILAIADPCDKNLREKAGEMGISHVFEDYRQMMDTVPLDVIHNCTPNSQHYEISRYALEKGIRVYSEKPLAAETGQAEALARLAAGKNLTCGVNFNYRNNAAVQEMRSRMEKQDPGRCFLVRASYLQDWLMYEEDYNWRMETDKGGASRAVADIGSHCFDTLETVLGERITGVFATLFTVHLYRKKPVKAVQTFAALGGGGGEYQRVQVKTEDAGFIQFRTQSKIPGMIVLSQVSGGYKNAFSLDLDCENYSMRWNQEEADHLLIGTREAGVQKFYAGSGCMTGEANDYAFLPAGHPAGWADALYNGISRFYRGLRDETYAGEKRRYADFGDGLHIMRLVDACMESSRAGRWTQVPE